MSGFDLAFDRLMGNEGKYSNLASDPGGETNWGISKRSYPGVDIRALTREGAKAIYIRDFWVRGHMDEYDPAIAFQVFDFAVNSGIATALRKLQAAAMTAVEIASLPKSALSTAVCAAASESRAMLRALVICASTAGHCQSGGSDGCVSGCSFKK